MRVIAAIVKISVFGGLDEATARAAYHRFAALDPNYDKTPSRTRESNDELFTEFGSVIADDRLAELRARDTKNAGAKQ